MALQSLMKNAVAGKQLLAPNGDNSIDDLMRTFQMAGAPFGDLSQVSDFGYLANKQSPVLSPSMLQKAATLLAQMNGQQSSPQSAESSPSHSPTKTSEPQNTAQSPDPLAQKRQLILESIRKVISDCLSSDVKLSGELTITTTNDEKTMQLHFPDVKEEAAPQQPTPRSASSKRKSSNPMRLPQSTEAEIGEDLSTKRESPKPAAPVNACHSNPSSPSADSGVLDLSRATSQAGSAPITPLKAQTTPTSQTDFATSFGAGAISNPLIEYLRQLNGVGIVPSTQPTLSISQSDSLMSNLQFAASRNQAPSMIPHLMPKPQTFGQLAANPFYSLQTAQQPQPQQHQHSQHQQQQQQRRRVSLGPRGPRGPPSMRRANGSSRRFACNQCHDEFPSLHALEQHTIDSHGAYRCHVCNAQFTQRSNLQRHALKHVGFKPFECKVCNKAYYRKDHLIRHMEMSHPGYVPRENITVHLTSSESLDFLNRKKEGSSPTPLQPMLDGDKLKDDSLSEDQAEATIEIGLDETDGLAQHNRPRFSNSSTSLSCEMMDTDVVHESDEEFDEEAGSGSQPDGLAILMGNQALNSSTSDAEEVPADRS